MKIPNFPKVIRIEPASQCNLKCTHCPTGTIDMNRGIMKDKIFDKIISDLKSFHSDVKVIVFYHGGEPLLNKKIFQQIKKMRDFKNDLFIKTVSNGMALNKSNAENLVKSSLDLIEFSLDGNSAEESESIRVGSNTNKIISNIKYLLKVIEQKKSKLRVEITTTQFYDKENPGNIATAPKWLTDVFKNDKVGFKPTFAYLWPHIDLNNKYTIHYVNNGIKNYCDHIVNTTTIRANGDVVACCYDLTTKLKTGNILNKSIKEIWDGKEYRSLRLSINEKKFPEPCLKCSVVNPNYYILKN